MKKEKFKDIVQKTGRVIFQNNDSPHRIALGFSLGVFLGVLPGTGPIASLVMATLLKVNKAAALAGSLLTNTWFSVVTAILSVKIGSAIMGLEWETVLGTWQAFLSNFSWELAFRLSVVQMILPVLIGYVVISLATGLAVYCLILPLVIWRKNKNRNKPSSNTHSVPNPQ